MHSFLTEALQTCVPDAANQVQILDIFTPQ